MRYWIPAAVVLVLGVWLSRGSEQAGFGGEAKEDAAGRKHGEYLVNEVAGCGHCHTPQNDKGQPDKARLLQGAVLQIAPKKATKNWADKAPDITHSGLAGKWSEADLIKFLTTGENPDGMKPMPPMPIFRLKKEDARAVTLYLRSLPGKKGAER